MLFTGGFFMSLNQKVLSALNAQINMEFSAFYTYLSATAYFEAGGLRGFAAWMRHHAEEEMNHAMKIYDFIHHRLGQVTLEAIAAPQQSWESPQAALEAALGHEQKVTTSINALFDLAGAEHDHATQSFLKWFIDEQVEEEEVVDNVLQKLRLIGNFGPGLYMLDRELAGQAPVAMEPNSEGE
jgi:ferritin